MIYKRGNMCPVKFLIPFPPLSLHIPNSRGLVREHDREESGVKKVRLIHVEKKRKHAREWDE